MGGFLKKLVLFFLWIFFLQVILFNIFQKKNYSWGNPLFTEKRKDFLTKNQVNTVFIGNSRLAKHAYPVLFDSLAHDKGIEIHSYNLAVGGLKTPEPLYLYKKLLEEGSFDNIKYTFFTVSSLDLPTKENLTIDRTLYYMDFSTLLFSIKYILNGKKLNVKGKIHVNYLFVKKFIYRYFTLRNVKRWITKKNSQLDATIANRNGYEGQVGITKDTLALKARTKTAQVFFEKPNSNNIVNKVLLERVQDIIDLSMNKGIQPFIVIPPLAEDYTTFRSLQGVIDAKYFIELANCNDYPSFYKQENVLDKGHLNAKGSKVFTYYLFQNFIKKIIK